MGQISLVIYLNESILLRSDGPSATRARVIGPHCMRARRGPGQSQATITRVRLLMSETVVIPIIHKQEAFEKCWAHSPLRAASRQFTRCR